MRRTLAGVMLAALLATAGAVAPAVDTAPNLAPCAAEDGPGPCYWDASSRGNGAGQSVIVDASGRVTEVAR